MGEFTAALAVIAAVYGGVYAMLRADRKELAKASDLDVVKTQVNEVIGRIDALDTKLSARLDTVVLELGKAFGRPA